MTDIYFTYFQYFIFPLAEQQNFKNSKPTTAFAPGLCSLFIITSDKV